MALAPEVRAAASQGGGSSSREVGGCFSEGRADCSLWNQAAGRAGAAGAEFGSVASQQGVEPWSEWSRGSSAVWGRGLCFSHWPICPTHTPRRALNSHLLANACDGTVYRAAEEPELCCREHACACQEEGAKHASSPLFSQDLRWWWLDAQFHNKARLVWSWCVER